MDFDGARSHYINASDYPLSKIWIGVDLARHRSPPALYMEKLPLSPMSFVQDNEMATCDLEHPISNPYAIAWISDSIANVAAANYQDDITGMHYFGTVEGLGLKVFCFV